MNFAIGDKSVPRSRVNAGDTSIDRRGRRKHVPALLSYEFRPFFLGASLYAAAAVPLWLWMLTSGTEVGGPFAGAAWHAHEMIFGYLGAVIAGFVLTAIPNWTGRLPLSGMPLAVLFGLWIAGRLACSFLVWPIAAMAVDLVFPLALAAAVWREVLAGKNWRNAPVAALLTLFGTANFLHHLAGMVPALGDFGIRLALGVAAFLIALIGGRITPSFTRNWLAKHDASKLPASFGRLDQLALVVTAIALSAWVLAPDSIFAGAALICAGALLVVRLARWRGLLTRREPIVLILHIGYFWLALALLMLGCSVLKPSWLPQSASLHALTAGAIATMTLAVMTRASRGHTGRPIESDLATQTIYAAVTIGALLRVTAPFIPALYTELLIGSGVAWSSAFALFALRYGPMLLRSGVQER